MCYGLWDIEGCEIGHQSAVMWSGPKKKIQKPVSVKRTRENESLTSYPGWDWISALLWMDGWMGSSPDPASPPYPHNDPSIMDISNDT